MDKYFIRPPFSLLTTLSNPSWRKSFAISLAFILAVSSCCTCFAGSSKSSLKGEILVGVPHEGSFVLDLKAQVILYKLKDSEQKKVAEQKFKLSWNEEARSTVVVFEFKNLDLKEGDSIVIEARFKGKGKNKNDEFSDKSSPISIKEKTDQGFDIGQIKIKLAPATSKNPGLLNLPR